MLTYTPCPHPHPHPHPSRASSFFVAKTLTSSPILVLEALLFSVIVYFMVGYQATAEKFFIYCLTMVSHTQAKHMCTPV
jgi:hypothetical protein